MRRSLGVVTLILREPSHITKRSDLVELYTSLEPALFVPMILFEVHVSFDGGNAGQRIQRMAGL